MYWYEKSPCSSLKVSIPAGRYTYANGGVGKFLTYRMVYMRQQRCRKVPILVGWYTNDNCGVGISMIRAVCGEWEQGSLFLSESRLIHQTRLLLISSYLIVALKENAIIMTKCTNCTYYLTVKELNRSWSLPFMSADCYHVALSHELRSWGADLGLRNQNRVGSCLTSIIHISLQSM